MNFMKDHFKKNGTMDPERINLSHIQEVTYWSKKFNITPGQLMEAVEGSGSSLVRVIEDYLKTKGLINL